MFFRQGIFKMFNTSKFPKNFNFTRKKTRNCQSFCKFLIKYKVSYFVKLKLQPEYVKFRRVTFHVSSWKFYSSQKNVICATCDKCDMCDVLTFSFLLFSSPSSLKKQFDIEEQLTVWRFQVSRSRLNYGY